MSFGRAANTCYPPAQYSAGITEIVLPGRGDCQLLLPMLAHLSRTGDDRWLTWLAPAPLPQSVWQTFGFAATVRRVHVNDTNTLPRLFETALNLGNSHTVVASLPKLPARQLRNLESLAVTQGCTGLIIRYRA